MKIAVFTELYAPSIGGQEAFFRGLGEALQARGHTVDIYCIGHERGLAPTETIGGLAVHRYPIAATYKRPLFSAMRRDWPQMCRFALRTRAVAKKGEHDFYLLNEWPLLHVLTLPRKARERALLHWCEVRASAFYSVMQSLLPRFVRLNGAISDSVGRMIEAMSGRPVITLPSGLDLTRAVYRPRAERRDIVTLGRIVEHKNLPLLIEAFEILCDRGYEGRLKIAGGGPDLPNLQARVAASPRRDRIDLLGVVSDEEKFELLSRCEVFAMPSRREGFPHVISEAMCCGLPAVTADYPENGAKNVVLDFGAGVVTGQTAQAFADGVAQARDDWERYSAKGLQTARTLAWSSIAERLESEILQTFAG